MRRRLAWASFALLLGSPLTAQQTTPAGVEPAAFSPAPQGTMTSADLVFSDSPAIISCTGGPITTAGTFNCAFLDQAAPGVGSQSVILKGPGIGGATGPPKFGTAVCEDLFLNCPLNNGVATTSTGGIPTIANAATIPNPALPFAQTVAKLTSSTAQQCNDATTWLNILSYTIPAGALGTSSDFHFWLQGQLVVPGATSRSIEVRVTLGGTTIFQDTGWPSPAAAATYRWRFEGDLMAHGATNSQWLDVWAILSAADSATTGFGDLTLAAGTAARNAGATGSKDSTASLVLNVDMRPTAAVASLCIQADAGMLTYIP